MIYFFKSVDLDCVLLLTKLVLFLLFYFQIVKIYSNCAIFLNLQMVYTSFLYVQKVVFQCTHAVQIMFPSLPINFPGEFTLF